MPSDVDTLAFGDVVLVPFPFTDQSSAKRRPAVVISNPAYVAGGPDVILMPVTSQLRGEARPGDVVVTDWESAGLLKPSAVKPVVATLERSLVLRRLGSLQEQDREALRRRLAELIG